MKLSKKTGGLQKGGLKLQVSGQKTDAQSSQTCQFLRGENLSLLDDSGVIHSYHQTSAAHTAAWSWPRAGSLLVALFF